MNWIPDKPIKYEYGGWHVKPMPIVIQSTYSDNYTFWSLPHDEKPTDTDVALWRIKSLKNGK